jgi:hypothetical protein
MPLDPPRHSRLAAALMSALLLAGPLHARFIEHKEHHLGPTGMFGVTSPKDIRITKVQEGSPADGRIKVGDVLVAAGGTVFKDRTRQQLAAAIDAAETKAGKGILTLDLQDGRSVDLQLKVLGSFSDTAPFNCPKTDALITQTAEHLANSRKFGRGDMNIGLLGLLATGEEAYIEVVRDTIHGAKWAAPDLKLSIDKYGRTAWGWGYTNLLLCEYYLLTGDEFVLPAIRQYSVALASGRDAAGLWGHGIASLDLNNGRKHGRLPGYAVMNQSSLPCFISLLLADKCGIKHPEIQEGIAQTHGFYTDFIGRGTLPYGVHNPNTKSYNNNGMSGLAAVAFSLHGNTEGAAFFSRMSAAAHNTMETGHTGHFFNQLWTGLGANLAGPETSAAFFAKTRWLHTFNRTWDGTFTYDGCGYPNGTFSYRGLSDAGSHLLNLCLGRKALHITGRDADASIWLKGADVQVVISLPSMDVKSMSDEELLASFGHPMPKVRVEAVWTLRPREHPLAEDILRMTREGTELERESAIGYFGYGCPKELMLTARDDLMAILRDPNESIDIRAAAAGSLCWLVEDGHAAFEDILKLVLTDKPDDPRGRIDESLGRSLNILCPNPHAARLVKDKDLFYGASLKLLDHKRANGRTSGAKLIANMPLEDFHRVADKVLHIIGDEDRSYHAYHNLGPKTESISILASLNIAGGIEAAFETLESPVGKAGFKIRMLMAVLPKYGASAKPFLPKIKSTQAGKFQKQWDAMIRQIEASEGARKMISIEEARRAGARAQK